MSFQGHIENGVVVFDHPVALPEGTLVRVEATGRGQHAEDSGCFHDLAPARPLDAGAKESLRALLTQKQYEALVEVVEQGGPDVDAIGRLRAASMT
jgi:hypothetical protein